MSAFILTIKRTAPVALFLLLVLVLTGEVRLGPAAFIHSLFVFMLVAFEYRKALQPEV